MIRRSASSAIRGFRNVARRASSSRPGLEISLYTGRFWTRNEKIQRFLISFEIFVVVRAAAVGTRRDKKIVHSMFGPASRSGARRARGRSAACARQIAAMDEDEAFAGCARPIRTGEALPSGRLGAKRDVEIRSLTGRGRRGGGWYKTRRRFAKPVKAGTKVRKS